MVYVVIGLALLLVFGPVMWLLPSKQEKELSLLRQGAILGGAKIQPVLIQTDPIYSATLARNPHLADYRWIRYQWFASEGEAGPGFAESWVQRKDRERGLVWEPRKVTSAEPAAVTGMLSPWREHQDVRFLALEVTPQSVAVVWNERTSPDEVKALSDAIRTAFFAPLAAVS